MDARSELEGASAWQSSIRRCTAISTKKRFHGLPTTFTEMGITDERILRAVADTCNLTAGCCKRLERDEILSFCESVYRNVERGIDL